MSPARASHRLGKRFTASPVSRTPTLLATTIRLLAPGVRHDFWTSSIPPLLLRGTPHHCQRVIPNLIEPSETVSITIKGLYEIEIGRVVVLAVSEVALPDVRAHEEVGKVNRSKTWSVFPY